MFIVLNVVMGVFYFGNFVFKGIFVWVGVYCQQVSVIVFDVEVKLLCDEDLLSFIIFVFMFKEFEVLLILVNVLCKLDYLQVKFDIKIVFEEGDYEMIDVVKVFGFEGIFEIVWVLVLQLQIKFKVCNYVLCYVCGDYFVIYDVEDKFEFDQFKKVVVVFCQSLVNIVCIQCWFNYYNVEENWFICLFMFDYLLWFDFMFLGLECLKILILFGGIFNYFKIDVLCELCVWDLFNVIEDVDFGICMIQKGYCVGVIDVIIFEEVNVL